MQRYRLDNGVMVEDPAGDYVLHNDAQAEIATVAQDLGNAQQQIAAKIVEIAQMNQEKTRLDGEIIRALRKLEGVNESTPADRVRRLAGEAESIIKNSGIAVHERNANYGGTARARLG